MSEKYSLPTGWRWVKLGEVCEVVSKGTTPTTYGYTFVNSGIPFLRAEDIIGGPVDFSSVAYHITEETHEFLDRSKLRAQGLKCIPGFCGAAFHAAFPAFFALNFGAEFFFMNSPSSIDTVTCPDGGNIVFKVTRIKEDKKK